tara:strand:- start:561 stop:977 length:417 start_codon:yes stop_codon:yes gene_type:complete
MKILNGNKYYDRADVGKYYKSACNSLIDPSIIDKHNPNLFGFSTEFLYSVDSEEMDVIKQGIDKLNNTLSWEFSSETALNLEIIEKCYHTLRTPPSNKLDSKSFKAISVEDITPDALLKYEHWLNGIGIEILFSFFSF